MSTPQQLKNKSKEKKRIQDIFKPGKSIEVVFNIDSHTPIVRRSIIYECDYASSQMLISQTEPKVLPSMVENSFDVTTLVEEELGVKFRGGIRCRVLKFINNYNLFKDMVTDAILIKFAADWRNVNIRSAYRLAPNDQYEVDARINYNGKLFLTGEHLKVSNISFTGIGLLIPKKTGHERNKLIDMKVGDNVGIEILLNEKDKENRQIMIKSEIVIVRVHPRFNEKSGYIGAKYKSLTSKDEWILSKFIHDAQMYLIRKSNQL